MTGHNDENAPGQPAQFQLLDDETCHYCLACAWVISYEESNARQVEHVAIHGLDLVGQWIDFGDVHGQERVVEGCVSVAQCFQPEEDITGGSGEVRGNRRYTEFLEVGLGHHLVNVAPGHGRSSNNPNIRAHVLNEIDLYRLWPVRTSNYIARVDRHVQFSHEAFLQRLSRSSGGHVHSLQTNSNKKTFQIKQVWTLTGYLLS